MSFHRIVENDVLLRKRQLRAEIARTRQQTMSTLADLGEERRRLASWQTYVRRFPVATLGTAFGVGLWLAAGRRGGGIPRSIAGSLMQWGVNTARGVVLQDLLNLWASARAGADNPSGDVSQTYGDR